MRKGPYHVRIWNPETRGIDTTVLVLDEFTIDAVYAAMAARSWTFQLGVYVAIEVEADDLRRIAGSWDNVLTFTVNEREIVTVERSARPT